MEENKNNRCAVLSVASVWEQSGEGSDVLKEFIGELAVGEAPESLITEYGYEHICCEKGEGYRPSMGVFRLQNVLYRCSIYEHSSGSYDYSDCQETLRVAKPKKVTKYVVDETY